MSKLTPGLVSVTFRELLPREVLELASSACLETIEWGADVHVPAGDLSRAREVARLTREEGLSVAAYGSYYRLGEKAKSASFAPVLETAAALGAPTIRVWAGQKGAENTNSQERFEIINDALRIVSFAKELKISVSLEYHSGTLTDDANSVRSLLMEVPDTSLKFLWQPTLGETVEQNLSRLRDLSLRLGNVHVFHWGPKVEDRNPLLDGEDRWLRYLKLVSEHSGPRACLLEFIRGNSRKQFMDDAATLRRWIKSLNFQLASHE